MPAHPRAAYRKQSFETDDFSCLTDPVEVSETQRHFLLLLIEVIAENQGQVKNNNHAFLPAFKKPIHSPLHNPHSCA
jgi:hypothetical protein